MKKTPKTIFANQKGIRLIHRIWPNPSETYELHVPLEKIHAIQVT